MIEFNTGKYFGEEAMDGRIDIFSSDRRPLLKIELGSKAHSYIKRVLIGGFECRDYLINCEIEDEIKKLDADLGEEPTGTGRPGGQLIV